MARISVKRASRQSTVVPADFPELRMIARDRDVTRPISEREAYSIYERNWLWVDVVNLTAEESNLVRRLASAYRSDAVRAAH